MRPGLCHGSSKRGLEQVKHKQASDRVSRTKISELEEEARKRGLETALDEKNKGFQLLQKSMRLENGKHFRHSEPPVAAKLEATAAQIIPITIKNDRRGLSVRVSGSSDKTAGQSGRGTKLTEEAISQFQKKESMTAMSRFLAGDLSNSRKSCHHLDTENGLTEPLNDSFWPEKVMLSMRVKTQTDDEGQEEPEVKIPDTPEELAHKLQEVTDYLRSRYHYCVWCGTRYDSDADLRDECPGDSRQKHD